MRVDQLILEVTRVCNMSCKHCLRGKSQNVYMTREMVDKTLEDIDSINGIVFTGGEPFLNLDIIEYTLEVVKQKGIFVGSFFIATNGKYYEPKQIEVCNAWMEYIVSMNYDLKSSVSRKFAYCEEELFNYSGIAVSLDEFHEEIPMENYLKYRMLSYYTSIKEHLENEKFHVIDEGSAHDNQIGTYHNSDFEVDICLDNYDDEVTSENICIDGDLYISANGNVVGDCDMSYDHIDQISIGNIHDNSLLQIIIDKYMEEAA